LEIAKKRAPRLSRSDRRTQILAAAVKFFSEEGFDGSTHNFAKKIGITQPLIYRYFDSKEELIREVYNTVFEGRWKSEWEVMLRDRTKSIKIRLFEFYILYTEVVFARDWMRIYLFSGLRELDINRWWSSFVESRILSTICDELRRENGADSTMVRPPTPQEMELMWSFQGSLFYHAMRRDVYRSPVHMEFRSFLLLAINVLTNSFPMVNEIGILNNQSSRHLDLQPNSND
jgi:AcrR family transcriptional regulator